MLIGISGLARSGKDTTAETMLKHPWFTKYAPYSFANPLKYCMNDWLRWGQEHGWGELKEVELPVRNADFNVLPIYIWQHFNSVYAALTPEDAYMAAKVFSEYLFENNKVFIGGEEGKEKILVTSPREVYQVFGTEVMREVIDENFWVAIAPKENVIISDVRFPNELDYIRENNGIAIKVNRPSLGEGVIQDHASENSLTNAEFDITIANDGTLEEFQENILQVINLLGEELISGEEEGTG